MGQESKEIGVDYITCELMLETSRACQSLQGALERVDVEIENAVTRERFVRRMERMQLLFRLAPSILDPRRIVCLCDRCADSPAYWDSNRTHYFCPDLTYREIAALKKIPSWTSVRDFIKAVEIPTDCYDNLPEIKQYES
ncbi:MAG: hypothetical protein BWY31_04363 [Lentisphaerae bacterium ADurb.Bin242]|nr:MAG: hypothetical protein BWY31_04363 [Lentisphaerae bacterium ADurb.Bin242]